MKPAPPRLAAWLIRVTVRRPESEFILGDLEEEYSRRFGHADGGGGLWYWRMAIASIAAQLVARREPARGETLHAKRGLGERMHGAMRDVRHSMRWLRRRPGFTATVVATLAIAVGANTAMFSVINAVLLRGLPFTEPERLVTVWRATPERPDLRSFLANVDFEDYRDQSRSFEALAAFRTSAPVWLIEGQAEVLSGAEVSEGYFDVFAVPLVAGRGISAEEASPDGPLSVVISWDLWQTRLGGDPDVVGRALRLNGIEHTIVGIAARGFGYPGDASVWLPERNDNRACGRNCLNIRVIGRLEPGVTASRAQADLNAIAERVAAAEPINENVRANVVPFSDYLVGDVRGGLRMLFAAVGMVLLIACANVATLLFTSATERAAQMALRKALGADRGRLIRQVLTESAVLCAAGAALGLLLAHWGVQLIGRMAAGSIPRLDEVSLDATVLGYTLLLMVVTTLLFGFAPALLAARGSLLDLLRGTGRNGAEGRARGRSLLIGAQVGLSVTLLIGTGLLLRTLDQLRSADLGFDPGNVARFSIALPAAEYPGAEVRIQAFDRIARRVAGIADVVATGAIAGSPLGGSSMVTSIERIGVPPGSEESPNALLRVAMPGYFEVMRIPVLQGRALESADRASAMPVVVVSRNAARQFWPGENPIGKQIRLGISIGMDEPDARTVVGVVGDVRSGSLEEVAPVEIYIPQAQAAAPSMTFVVRGRRDAMALLPEIREALHEIEPNLPMRSAGAMEDDVSRHLAQPGFYSILLGTFAGIALVLSAVGLYGLVAYQVARRRREIGIRMAVGAHSDAIVRMLASTGLWPALLGLFIGAIAAVQASRALESLLYGIQPLDPATWITVILFLALVSVAAAVLPARRASRVMVTEVLRE